MVTMVSVRRFMLMVLLLLGVRLGTAAEAQSMHGVHRFLSDQGGQEAVLVFDSIEPGWKAQSFSGSLSLLLGGRLERLEEYKEGTLNGRFLLFGEAGFVSIIGQYRNGQMSGRWMSFDAVGKMEEVRYYAYGYALTGMAFDAKEWMKLSPDDIDKVENVFLAIASVEEAKGRGDFIREKGRPLLDILVKAGVSPMAVTPPPPSK